MPTITSGNTNAAVVMIGEKVSDLLKENWIKKNEGSGTLKRKKKF
jgi:choline dehydrogenase-like flavoprotein